MSIDHDQIGRVFCQRQNQDLTVSQLNVTQHSKILHPPYSHSPKASEGVHPKSSQSPYYSDSKARSKKKKKKTAHAETINKK